MKLFIKSFFIGTTLILGSMLTTLAAPVAALPATHWRTAASLPGDFAGDQAMTTLTQELGKFKDQILYTKGLCAHTNTEKLAYIYDLFVQLTTLQRTWAQHNKNKNNDNNHEEFQAGLAALQKANTQYMAYMAQLNTLIRKENRSRFAKAFYNLPKFICWTLPKFLIWNVACSKAGLITIALSAALLYGDHALTDKAICGYEFGTTSSFLQDYMYYPARTFLGGCATWIADKAVNAWDWAHSSTCSVICK